MSGDIGLLTGRLLFRDGNSSSHLMSRVLLCCGKKYLMDCYCNNLYRLCPKLTPIYVHLTRLSRMNVRLAAQVGNYASETAVLI